MSNTVRVEVITDNILKDLLFTHTQHLLKHSAYYSRTCTGAIVCKFAERVYNHNLYRYRVEARCTDEHCTCIIIKLIQHDGSIA